jgi:hypothetical protein
MRTSSGLICEHEEQQREGLCATCDAYGESHDSCVDCSAELDDEDHAKDFIHEGHDGLRRCTDCHDSHDRQYLQAKARDDYEYACDQKVSEWKNEGGR